jgi:hypothetical protein
VHLTSIGRATGRRPGGRASGLSAPLQETGRQTTRPDPAAGRTFGSGRRPASVLTARSRSATLGS